MLGSVHSLQLEPEKGVRPSHSEPGETKVNDEHGHDRDDPMTARYPEYELHMSLRSIKRLTSPTHGNHDRYPVAR